MKLVCSYTKTIVTRFHNWYNFRYFHVIWKTTFLRTFLQLYVNSLIIFFIAFSITFTFNPFVSMDFFSLQFLRRPFPYNLFDALNY